MRQIETILPTAVYIRTVVDDVDRENYVAFKDDKLVFSNFQSKLAVHHRALQQVRKNVGFSKLNMSSEL